MSDQLTELAESCREDAERLTNRAERLEAGEELACYHSSGYSVYEVYCTGCGTHIGEFHDIQRIPFKSDAFCFSCSHTTEKVEEEK